MVSLKAARKRLDPERRNGFDAIVICEEDGSGWRVHSVIEYENQDLAKRLSQTFHGFQTVRVPDPAAWQGPQKEEATGDGNSYSSHLNNLLAAKNLILEGPPGTGKTHIALEIAREIAGPNFKQYRMEEVLRGRTIDEVPFSEIQEPPLIWEMIQLHPSYSYEDFMRGIRTDPKSSEFELCAVDGILPKISKLARRRAGKPTLLILDELNRSNLSVVFGEAIFALDPAQRGRPIRLQYTKDGKDGDELIIPRDLLLVGTLNTADKSISAIDFATRRRFRFTRLSPSGEALREYYKSDTPKHQKNSGPDESDQSFRNG
jgi:5-methylcytosine-specific restriction enzyme B